MPLQRFATLRILRPVMSVIMMSGMFFCGPTASAQYMRTDHFDAAVLTLKRCTASSNTGEQHALIVSLRALNDQSLRPFFSHSQSPQAGVRESMEFLGLQNSPRIVTLMLRLSINFPSKIDRLFYETQLGFVSSNQRRFAKCSRQKTCHFWIL